MSSIIDELLTITTSTQAGVVSSVGFGSVLMVSDDSSIANVTAYANNAAAQADADLSATAKAWAAAYFAARQFAAPLYIVAFDDAGGDDPGDGFAAAKVTLQAAGTAVPYWMATQSRDAADILAGQAWIAADDLPHVGIWQQADADSLTTGYPAAFSTIQASERKLLIYAAAGGNKYLDADCAAFLSAVNPSLVATGGHWLMGGQVGDGLTGAQRDFARGHAIATGRTLPGAVSGNLPIREYDLRSVGGANPVPLYLTVTVDYVEDRIRTSIASAAADYIARGARFPGGVEGDGVLRGLIGAPLSAITGAGDSAWLAPTDVFGGRAYDLTLAYDGTTRTFSGTLRINVRDQIAEIDLNAIFGSYLAE